MRKLRHRGAITCPQRFTAISKKIYIYTCSSFESVQKTPIFLKNISCYLVRPQASPSSLTYFSWGTNEVTQSLADSVPSVLLYKIYPLQVQIPVFHEVIPSPQIQQALTTPCPFNSTKCSAIKKYQPSGLFRYMAYKSILNSFLQKHNTRAIEVSNKQLFTIVSWDTKSCEHLAMFWGGGQGRAVKFYSLYWSFWKCLFPSHHTGLGRFGDCHPWWSTVSEYTYPLWTPT